MPETKIAIESSMYKALPLKPIEHVEKLIAHLKPHANTRETKCRQIINNENNRPHQCYLLLKGTIGVFRARDGFMLNSEVAPFIPLEKVNDVIANENLWESLAKVLIYTAGRVYDHCTRISAPTSYDIIRAQLYELMRESNEFRQNITAANYIQSRTFLSRSSVMKILADLKKGGYIVTDRGVLKQIQQNIPLKY